MSSYHEQARALGVTDDVIAALDLLVDDGVPAERAAGLAVAAHRSGRDAEEWARHLIKLRKALRRDEAKP